MRILNRFIYKFLFYIAEYVEKRNIIYWVNILKKNEKSLITNKEDFIIEKIRKILIFSYENIPFYKEEFDQVKFNPYLFRKIEQLSDIPYIDKSIVKKNYKKFLSNKNNEILISRKTGGSTGDKLIIYYSKDALDITAAINIKCLESIGKNIGDKEIHISSNIHEDICLKDRLKEYMKCFVLHRKNIYVDFYSENKYEDIINEIKQYKPKLIQGFPSFAYDLACFAEKKKLIVKNIFDIYESTGEVLYLFQKEKIEKIFNCKVYNRYGNAEFGIIAYEDNKNLGLKVMEDINYIENDKKTGEIVVTSLTNFAMPLIRYKTGDIGEIKEVIESGEKTKYITNIKGRIHDRILLEENRYISTSFILDYLDKYNFINNFQVYCTNDKIDVFIQINNNCLIDELTFMQEKLKNIMQLKTIKLNIILVKHLIYTDAGKFRYIINKVPILKDLEMIVENNIGKVFLSKDVKIFPEVGSMKCIMGFFEMESTNNKKFIWSKKFFKICFDKDVNEINLLNLLENNNLKIFMGDVKIKEIELLKGWNTYKCNLKRGKIYSFEVEKIIPNNLKNNDSREIAVGFKEY